jgi:hypothetical protein
MATAIFAVCIYTTIAPGRNLLFVPPIEHKACHNSVLAAEDSMAAKNSDKYGD